MKCIKCKGINIISANYCKFCGYHFSEKEQKEAKNKTIVGKLEMLEKAYNVCTLKVITDHIVFKIISLLVVIILGIFFLVNNGAKVKILESDNYKMQYNTKEDEYYLLANEEQTTLDLYVPNRVQNIVVKNLDVDNNELSSFNYKDKEAIVLNMNGIGDYYLLEAIYENEKKEQIKMYVYKVED